MSVTRTNAVINNTIILENIFRFAQTGDCFNPYAISKVEILDSDGVTIIETISGANIVHDSLGHYHVVASAITTAKTIYDKWYFTPSQGAVQITKTNPCIVWEVSSDSLNNITSTIEICNLALSHLGIKPITSLIDANEPARALNRIFNVTKDVVLRAKDWRFATVKDVLDELDVEVPGWNYVYMYPPRCLFVRKVFVDTDNYNPDGIEYEVLFIPSINAKVIACSFSDAYIEYTYQMADTTLFDKSFVLALSFLLAAQVAKPLTGNDDIAKLMLQIYGTLVSDAARINNSEKNIKPNQVSSFEEAR